MSGKNDALANAEVEICEKTGLIYDSRVADQCPLCQQTTNVESERME